MMKNAQRMAIVAWIIIAIMWIAGVFGCEALGAEFSTENFTASHPSADFARQVAERAEAARAQFAIEWLGRDLPPWQQRCPITIRETNGNGGGATSYDLDRGEVFNWRMTVQGRRSAILDDVIPHEVTHTITASHFRRKVPRWADEGICTLSESIEAQNRQWAALKQTWATRPIPVHQLIRLQEYPKDGQAVLSMYARGYYLTRMLVERRGQAAFLEFLDAAHRSGWDAAIQSNYGIGSIAALDQEFRSWIPQAEPTKAIAMQTPVGRPSLYVFGYPGCEHCERWKRDAAAGKFDLYDWTYFDITTPDGAKVYRELVAAIRKAGGRVEMGFPAFHAAGRAVVHSGYDRKNGAERLIQWGRETFRLPVTIFDAVTQRGGRGVSPPPAGFTLEEPEAFERKAAESTPEPTAENVEIRDQAAAESDSADDAADPSDQAAIVAETPQDGDEDGENGSGLIWAILSGIGTAVIEAMRNRAIRRAA